MIMTGETGYMAEEQKYQTRNYCRGDEDKIIDLFNGTYKDYAGFVPRTREYWVWSCLERPDVDREGIIIAEDKTSGEIVGYAVIGKSGSIWEFCIGLECERKKAFSLIAEKAMEYIAEVGADHIGLNVPAEDNAIRKMLEKLGFVESPQEQVSVRVLDFETLIGSLAKNVGDKLKKHRENILFIMEDTHSVTKLQFGVEIDHGKANPSSHTQSHSISVETSVETLTSILFGALKPSRAFITRKLKVRPMRKIYVTLELLSILQLHDPWFHPKADFG